MNFIVNDFVFQCSTNEFNAIEIRDLPVCKSESTGQEEDEDSIDLSCKEVPPPSKTYLFNLNVKLMKRLTTRNRK